MSRPTVKGYDISAVEQWILRHVAGLTPPFEWMQLQGGHSNLTCLITDQKGTRAVIRRPPEGQLLRGAHDMGREWALISALESTAVPVPTPIGFCDDEAVTGAKFYLMDEVQGRPLYSASDTLDWVPQHKREILAYSFIDALADLHSLNPEELGLDGLGRTDGYLARQLKTWYGSWTSSVSAAKLDDPRAHILREFFLDNIPEQTSSRVVHGDYGLHNCLIGEDSKIAAVLDWEISTLGDPLADLAYALNPWTEPGEPLLVAEDHANNVPGMPSRTVLAQRYASRTGQNLRDLNYYRAFSLWKSAAIMQGVYARYLAGQKGAEGVDLGSWHSRITGCLKEAEAIVATH